MARQILISLLVILALLSPAAAVTERKVLFYEVQAPSGFRITGSGYSLFSAKVGELSGFDTASMTGGTITRDKLEPYDVVIMQDLNTPLSTEEIIAIRWYVGDHGGGLFINGDQPAGVNNLGQIFGVMMDTEDTFIVDTSLPLDTTQGGTEDGVSAEEQKFYFRTSNFPDTDDPQTVDLDEVTLIGVYKAHPLFVESVSVQSLIGNTRVIAAASQKAYTETGTFSVSEEPPIAARAFFGKGAVVVLSDFDMLSDAHITDVDDFNNTMGNSDFGLAIVQWLADDDNRDLTAKSPSELQQQVLDLQKGEKRLLADKAGLEEDKARLQELYDANFTIFSEEKVRMDTIIQDKNLELVALEEALDVCSLQKLGGIVVTICVLLGIAGAFVKKKLDERKAKSSKLSDMFGKKKEEKPKKKEGKKGEEKPPE